MKKIGNKSNFRVVVTPRSLTDFGGLVTSRSMFYDYTPEGQKRFEDDSLRRCENVAADIKRHADDVGHVAVEFDQEHICASCGRGWTEESPVYNGGCCDEDESHNPDASAASAA